MQSLCMGHSQRARTQMLAKEPSQVAAGDTKAFSEALDVVIVQCTVGYEAQATTHGCGRTFPGGSSWRTFRATTQTWAKSGLGGGRCRRIESDVLALRRVGRADGAAIDSGCSDANVKPPVKACVSRQSRTLEYIFV